MYVSSHLHLLADARQGKEPSYPLYRKLLEPSNWSGGMNQEFEDIAVTRNVVVWWWLMYHSTCNWFFVYTNFSTEDAIHNKIRRGDLFCSGWKYGFRRKFSDILKVMCQYSLVQAGDKYGHRCLFVPTELLSTYNTLLLHQPDRIQVDILENTVCLLGTLTLKVKRQWRHSHRFLWPRHEAVTSQPPVSVVTILGSDVTVTSFHSYDWGWST